MTTERVSIRIPAEVRQDLRRKAAQAGRSESDMIREAVTKYLQEFQPPRSVYDVFNEAGLIGAFKGPKDLATNKKYMKGFGRHR